jgi:hypothetical protein
VGFLENYFYSGVQILTTVSSSQTGNIAFGYKGICRESWNRWNGIIMGISKKKVLYI